MNPPLGYRTARGFLALSRVLTGISSFACGAVPGTGKDPGRLPPRPNQPANRSALTRVPWEAGYENSLMTTGPLA
jgi:hypothetical protein